MTRACDLRTLDPRTTLSRCHPERSLARSEANRQTNSKDPVRTGATEYGDGNFHIVIRFFDEHDTESDRISNCEAAAWDSTRKMAAQSGLFDGNVES